MASVIQQRGQTSQMRKVAADIRNEFRQDQYRNFTMSQSLPKYTDLAISGSLHSAGTGAGTAKATLTAIPTTTAEWALYNGGSGNTVLVVIRVSAFVTSGTIGVGSGLVLGMSPTVQASAVSAYASSVSATLTPGATATEAIFGNAVTLAGAPAWQHWGGADVAALEGSVISADVEGLYVIPAGFALGAAVISNGGSTPLYGAEFTWAELKLDRVNAA